MPGDFQNGAGRKRRHGFWGEKPPVPGVGLEVVTMVVPGQEDAEDPIVFYKAIDRHVGVQMMNGVARRSTAPGVVAAQARLLAEAGGLEVKDVLVTDTSEPEGEAH